MYGGVTGKARESLPMSIDNKVVPLNNYLTLETLGDE